MKTILPLLALLTTPALATTSAANRGTPVVKLEHAWIGAIRQHDTAMLARILADDFTDIDVHGHIRDKADAMTTSTAPSGTTQTLRDLRVRRYGDSAVANGINVVHSKAKGWTVQIAFTDVFVRRHGQWQAVSAQETLQRPAHQ